MAKQNADDLNEVDLDADFDAEQIGSTARQAFRLTDKLKGIKHRHARIALFLNMEAVDAYNALNSRIQSLVDAMGAVDLTKEGGAARHEALMTEHERLEPQLEEARAAMLKEAVSIHLKAWPNVAAKVANREGRKRFHDEALGGVPPERQVEASNWIDMQLLGASIVKIVDAEGNEDMLEPYEESYQTEGGKSKKRTIHPRKTIGQQLSDDLPPSQWQRLYDAYQRLTLTDQIAETFTSDPGF